MTRSIAFAAVAALLMAIDGLAISMSRVALLDNLLTFFVAARVLVRPARSRTHHDAHRRDRRRALGATAARPRGVRSCGTGRGSSPPARPLGAATRGEVVGRLGARRSRRLPRRHRCAGAAARRRARSGRRMPLRQGAATFVLFVPVAFVVYLASWTGWLVTDGGYDRHSADANPATGFWSWVPPALQSLWTVPRRDVRLHVADSPPSTATRARPGSGRCCCGPTAMYYHHDAARRGGLRGGERLLEVIASMPEPADLVRRRRRGALPRVPVRASRATGATRSSSPASPSPTCRGCSSPSARCSSSTRSLILPFMMLALTFALRDIAGPSARRLATAGSPASGSCWCSSASRSRCRRSGTRSSSAMPVPYDFWRLHNWMQSWI